LGRLHAPLQFCAATAASSPETRLFADVPAGKVVAETGLRLITTISLSETAIDQLSF
jgi:hypothetical protein